MDWNIGDILDRLETVIPQDHTALVHAERRTTWGELSRRSNNIARALADRGIGPGAKAAFYLRNRPAYMEFLAACLKGRLTHVNVNYRYREQELSYILDNSDSEVVVYDPEFAPIVAAARPHCPRVKVWLQAGDEEAPDFAERFEDLARGEGRPLGLERDPQDEILLYTGGTTGMPKGVIWTHDVIMKAQLTGLSAITGVDPPASLDAFIDHAMENGRNTRQLPAAPLMHATGMTLALAAMAAGGTVITLPSERGFDPEALWRTVEREGVTSITIIGDAFAKPMLRALDEAPGRYRTDTVQSIISSGVVWSQPVKEGLLRHMPDVGLLDSLGSTEAPSIGVSIATKDGEITPTLDFRLSESCKVFDENDRPVEPGSGKIGFMARSDNIPLGYYKDPEKTARTFRVIDGVRYAIPGDMCTVAPDGRLNLLGRSSGCINTGGEKVFAEEVEEVLKTHPSVYDANVVGIPHERWGQAVTAVVAPRPGEAIDEDDLKAYVRARLADYKTPKHIFEKGDLDRLPNGKANYKAMRAYAEAQAEERAAAS